MEGFYRMTPFEVATGWLTGYEEQTGPEKDLPADPLGALEELLLPALLNPPCFVEFSGGRDSSAILATAVNVARRRGLQLPVPMTRIYPEVPETREDEWQELVVRHLQINEWHRIEYTDEFDILGPTATESLRQHGVLWPPTIHTKALVWRAAGKGTVVSGQGGDEIFGSRRLTPLAGLLAGNVHPRRQAATLALKTLAPRSIRKAIAAKDLNMGDKRVWLRNGVRERFQTMLVQDQVNEPLRWDRSTRRHPYRRADSIGLHNLKLSAASQRVMYLAPFLEPDFTKALALRGGRLGFPGRSAAMRALFSHLLPLELLERTGKAEFTGTFLRGFSRHFMDNWTGEGVDRELVDPALLRREWRKAQPSTATLPLLHSVWLRLED
jgi:hypothetical protein